MALQGWMLDLVVIGEFVARRLCQVLDRHSGREQELDGVIKTPGRDCNIDAGDIAADPPY